MKTKETLEKKAIQWWNTLEDDSSTETLLDSKAVEEYKNTKRFYRSKLFTVGCEDIPKCEDLTISDITEIYKSVFKDDVPNKQFTQFSDELFTKYLHKFSPDDKLKIKNIVDNMVNEDMLYERFHKRLNVIKYLELQFVKGVHISEYSANIYIRYTREEEIEGNRELLAEINNKYNI